MESTNKYAILDKLSFGAIFIMGVLLPLFFLPIEGMFLDASKSILVSVAVLVSFSLWLLGRLVDGAFSFPKSIIFGGGTLLLLSALVASAVSLAPRASFIGQGFEITTFAFTAVVLVLLFLSSVFFQSRERAFYFYGGLLLSGIVVAIYQLVRLLGTGDILSFGIFESQVANLVGKWNDLSIFFGAILLLSMMTVELLTIGRALNFLLYALMAFSLFFLALINFSLAWIIVGVVSLVLVVYGVYANRADGAAQLSPSISIRQVKLPIAPLVVMIISILFFFTSSSLGTALANKFNISQFEVRPSLPATFGVAKETLKTNPLFGSGPNRFTSQWLAHKPDGINATLFWNTDFTTGFGIVPTMLVTEGIFGLLSWIIFVGLFFFVGFKAMFNFSLNRLSRYLVVSSFVLAGYLFAFVVLYVPSTTLYVLAFLIAGIMIATLTNENIIGRYEVRLLGDPKLGFVSVLVLIFFIIASLSLGYFFAQKFVSFSYFQKSLSALNREGSIEKTETYLGKAINLSGEDIYYRALSELNLIKLNNLVQQQGVSQDTLRAQFQTMLGAAIDSAKKATEIDKTNYTNFISLGRVYEAIVPLKVAGAYEAALDSYGKALLLNPESPAILLGNARLEIAQENNKAGRAYIDKALAKKQNYTEAVFFLSQLEARDGNIKEAIRRTEDVSLLAPNDITVLFQLGLLKYNDRDYAGAILAFERAISLSSNYANAKYFLGLSYQKVGRVNDAILQFEGVQSTNPDNQEVKNIITNLRAGRAPFANVPPPDNKPEARKKPPISEEE